ncbi:MAG: Flp pilus assembly protein CpaB [Tindallia sp. MSAO_Bac2]|nr:MAG: Flp pilus assembly protein CpaB [Tindallia sp. MSAO_Bac2]
MKNKLILLIAIVFGAMASLGAFRYLQHVEATYQLSGNYTQVATATQNIPARATIQSSMLEFVEVPVEYVMSGAVLEAEEAVGKLARSDIYEGEQLIDRKLMDREDRQGGLAVKVDEGKRAISVPVGMVTALHGLIEINDRVDVMVTFDHEETQSSGDEYGSSDTSRETVTSTIISNVPVLAVNARIEGSAEGSSEPSTVTVMVEPEEAQWIALAIQQGSIQFTLRSPEDDTEINIPMTGTDGLVR